MSVGIVLVMGGGWRNLRVKDIECRPCSYQTDIPNNDLGFRTFRNARERRVGACVGRKEGA